MSKSVNFSKSFGLFISILFFSLTSFRFFNPSFLAELDFSIFNYLYVTVLFFMFMNSYSYYSSKYNFLFSSEIKLLLVAVFCSLTSAIFLRNQSIQYSFFAAIFPVGGYLFYFYLLRVHVHYLLLEKLIVLVGLLYLLFFGISFSIYPSKIFEYQIFDDDRGAQRIILNGIGFLFLLYFLALNKASIISTTNRLFWIIISIVCFIGIFYTLERLYVLSTTILTIFYLLKDRSFILKVLFTILTVYVLFYISQLEIIQILLEKTSSELLEFKEYIRYRAAIYFLDDFQLGLYTRIMGNGFAYGDKSVYGREMLRLHNQYFWIEDLGFLGLYIYIGLLGVWAYVKIYIKLFKHKFPKELAYCKLYLLFILFNGLTNYGTYNENFVLPIIICLYSLSVTHSRQVA